MKRVLSAAAVCLVLAGCGGGGDHPAPALSKLPLVPGARVLATATDCDSGSDAYCALEVVITGPAYRSSQALFDAEERHLRRRGWRLTNGYIGNEHGAESPGHGVRVTYARADQDLQGIDFNWIHRARTIVLALDRTLYGRTAALSLMLETGSA